ncbi:hypothetical protein [Conexibacter arvalis]|uniref:Uncharacterized protein n=1 Tax=Conexibacter arvalis TaxID=912552 RepID=A0A840IHE8_9ACTN|nr:hypothetical protein [Conexibacter arvalis]MBB4664199.1 hypothetical protein [Conexibacter arvalis]
MRVPRTRGAVSGMVIALLGLWGALIPFIGPSFDYAIGSTDAWDWSAGRFWLSVLPGIVAIVGGLLLMTSARRPTASLGAMMGVAAGAWFIVGPTVSRWWNDGVSQAGAPHGSTTTQILAELGWFLALGALILYFAAAALGRLSVRSVRDVELAEEATAAETTTAGAPATGASATGAPAAGATAPAGTTAGPPAARARGRGPRRGFRRRSSA